MTMTMLMMMAMMVMMMATCVFMLIFSMPWKNFIARQILSNSIGRPTLLLLLFLGEANLFNVIVIGRGQPC